MTVIQQASNLKITVLRRFKPEEVFPTPVISHKQIEQCGHYGDGEVFIVEENGLMPEGFCVTAWNDIFPTVQTLRFGGNLPWLKEPGVSINSCSEGRRPVIFKIERI